MSEKAEKKRTDLSEEPVISERIYPVIDTDLARDNLENDLPAADLEDLKDGGEK